MNPYFAPSEAELLAHSSFLEVLSRTLVSDRQTADDLVQDTWLTVLEHPPRHSINPAGWIRTVAKNLARRDRRTRVRQMHRESEVARPEGIPGVDESLERTRSLSRVANAVEALPEPYRTVVFLRFFENKPPREIATELDVALSTIKSQLHRGLERLRADLEDEFGQEGADWRGVLCACFGWSVPKGPPITASAPTPAVSVGSKVALVAALLVAVASLVLIINYQGSAPSATTLAASDAKAELAESTAVAPQATRQKLVPPTTAEPGALLSSKLLLAVVDAEGFPVEGATVWLARAEGLEARGTTDPHGLVSIPLSAGDAVPPRVFSQMQSPVPPLEPRLGVMATAPGFCSTVVNWLETDKLGVDAVPLELNPHGFQLSGLITDESGLPIPGAIIERHDPREGVIRNDNSDLAVFPVPTLRTDGLGRYKFGSLPLGLCWLRVSAPGYAEHWERHVAHDGDPVQLNIALLRGGGVAGLVLDPEGRPIADARIWTTARGGVHEIATHSNQSGEFHLAGIPEGERFFFVRGSNGDGLAARTQLNIQPDSVATWYPQLGVLPGIRVRFLNEAGAPLANLPVHMRLHCPTRLARIDQITDGEGRLVIYEQSTDIRRIDFYLTARYGTLLTFPDAHLSPIAVGDTEHTVVIETANLERGGLEFDFVTSDGQAFEEFTILARGARDGVFRRVFTGRNSPEVWTQNVVPDEVELRANCTGLGHIELQTVTVRPGTTTRLPEVHAPKTGVVRIVWNYAPEGGEEVSLFQLLGAPRSRPLGVRIPRNDDLTPLETYSLFPGNYSLRVSKNRKPLRAVPFTIESGFETLIEVGPDSSE